MSALHVSRRAALGVVGVGSAAITLAACAGNVSSISSPSERTDFSGEIKFDSFEPTSGEYKPATKDHAAENVPKPKKPENANEKSVAGFYSTLGYLFASFKYLFEAFDPEPLLEVMADSTGQQLSASQLEQFKQLGMQGMVWFYDTEITGSLKTPQPNMDGDTYTWDGTVTMKIGGMGGRAGMSREMNQEQSTDTKFKGTYKDGKWMIDPGNGASASGSPSSSSSAGTDSLFGI